MVGRVLGRVLRVPLILLLCCSGWPDLECGLTSALAAGPEGAESGAADGSPAAVTPRADAYRSLNLEQSLDSLRVRCANGRRQISFWLRHTPEGVFVTLGALARATGGGFKWNPETWQGSFQVDSAAVSFALDTQVFWVKGEAIQVPSPVRYAEGTVWIPLAVLDGVVVPLLGDRCRWNPANGWLELAGPKPWVETIELSGGPGLAALTLAPIEESAIRLRWDPAGVIRLQADGIFAPPGSIKVSGRVEGLTCDPPSFTPRGLEVLLRPDPGWVGIRLRPGKSGHSMVLEVTGRRSEVGRGRFQPLTRYLERHAAGQPTGPGRTILLEISPPPTGEGAAALQSLAERLKTTLEQELGHRVVLVEDRSVVGRLRSPSGLPETPGLPDGDCWIGLRLESWPGTSLKQFLVVIPGLSSREEALPLSVSVSAGGGQQSGRGANPAEASSGLETVQVAPWGQISRLYSRSSRTLARTIADHLNYSWKGRPVVVSARPARIFRGVAMPSVLLYPAAIDDEEALSILQDPEQAGQLAHDLAFALDESFLRIGGDE